MQMQICKKIYSFFDTMELLFTIMPEYAIS